MEIMTHPKLNRGSDGKYKKKINYVPETISYSYKYCKLTKKEILLANSVLTRLLKHSIIIKVIRLFFFLIVFLFFCFVLFLYDSS